MQKEFLIDLSDAVVVIRQPDGNENLKQSINLMTASAASGWLSSGAVWGTLRGLLFFNPLASFAVSCLIGESGEELPFTSEWFTLVKPRSLATMFNRHRASARDAANWDVQEPAGVAGN